MLLMLYAIMSAVIPYVLKVVTIVLAIPRAAGDLNKWRQKQIAWLHVEYSVTRRRSGYKPTIPRWKRWAYWATKMPLHHLWWDRREMVPRVRVPNVLRKIPCFRRKQR